MTCEVVQYSEDELWRLFSYATRTANDGYEQPPLSSDELGVKRIPSMNYYYRTPLSEFELAEAYAFAEATVNMPNPYDMFFQKTGVLLTIGTPFGRISTAFRQALETGNKPDYDLISEINVMPELEEHYSIQTVSSHKSVSVRRYMALNERAAPLFGVTDMVHGAVHRAGSQYVETLWFRYINITITDYFEIAVPAFLRLSKERACVPYPLR